MASLISLEPIDFHNHSDSYDNSVALSTAVDESNPRKRRKTGDPIIHPHRNQTHTPPIQWRSHTQQTIYSTKLIQALRQVLCRTATHRNADRDVRDAANRILATTAKGRTRWSRAILASPLGGSRFQKANKHKKVKKVTGYGMWKKKRTNLSEGMRRMRVKDMSRRKSPAVHLQRKLRVLGTLVPGCRKVSLPNLLEEATDYVSALEMQVQAMKVITELLAGGTAADRVNPPLS